MNKAFTLVELLAVIAILAIILFIAVPYFMNAVNNSKYSALAKDEVMMANTAERYMIKNISKLPFSVGGTTQVTLSTLVSENYMNNIISPFDKSVTCDGYVLVTRLTSGDYDYTPYLNCDNIAGNYTDDGLVANFKLNNSILSSTPNAINGSLTGSLVSGINRLGSKDSALNFTSNSYVDYGDTEFEFTNFTVSLWIKSPTNISTDATFPKHVTNIVGKGNWNSANNWFIGYKSSGALPAASITFAYGILWNAGPSLNVASFDLSVWNNFVGVATATDQKLYLNGNLVSTVISSHTTVSNDYNLQIARSSYGSIYFTGLIDDTKIYSRALTASEIKNNYNLDKLRSY